MGKVVWTSENDRKLLIRLIDKSAKSYNSEALCQLFPGATPKAIEERIAKLKREAKALDKDAGLPSTPTPGKGGKAVGNIYTNVPATGSVVGSSPSLKRFRKEAVDDEEVPSPEKKEATPKKSRDTTPKTPTKPRGGAASAALKKLKVNEELMLNGMGEVPRVDGGMGVSVGKEEDSKY